MGLTSFCLCFRVATAALWIRETPHPYSKQSTEAHMLPHKHASISVSDFWLLRRGRPLPRLRGNNLFTCMITFSTPGKCWGYFVVTPYCTLHAFMFIFRLCPAGGQNNRNIMSSIVKQAFKESKCCIFLCPAGQSRSDDTHTHTHTLRFYLHWQDAIKGSNHATTERGKSLFLFFSPSSQLLNVKLNSRLTSRDGDLITPSVL